jgi:hypothetical protein
MSADLSTRAFPARAHPDPRARAGSAGLWAARLLGVVSLAGSVGISLWIVLAAAERPSFLSGPARLSGFAGWVVGPLAGHLPGLTTDAATLQRDFVVALGGLLVCWLVAALCARTLHVAWVAVTLVAIGVIYTLGPPLSLTDVFNYLHYGRMGAVHHLNPYADLPVRATQDPSYPLSNWHHLLSPYGPLFTLVTYPLALVPLHVAYWVWKAIVLVASLGVLGLVWWIAPRAGRSPQRALAFAGLNPLVLVYGIGGAHNDPLMLLTVLAAVALAIGPGGLGGTDRSTPATSFAAGVAAVAGGALKLSMGVLAPLVVLGARRRSWALAGVLAAGVATLALVELLFGGHAPAVAVQERLVTPLSLPQVAGELAGAGGLTPTIRTISHLVLAATLAGACLAVALDRRRMIGACGVVMLVAVLTLGWTMPWYVWWILPFAALAQTRWLAAACVVLTVWLALGAIPQMPKLIHSVGYFPTRSSIGKINHAYTEQLLR